MKKTYNQTFMISHEKLQNRTIKILVFDRTKYEDEEPATELNYTGLTAWDMIEGGPEAEEIEESGLIDENREYLVLHFNTGKTATFRNSHVDMLIR